MVYSTTDKIFASIWVAFIPVVIALSIFLYLVLCATKRKTVDAVTSSLLLSRVVHAGGATTMACIFKLEHWQWSKTECDILMWMWIAAWTSDFLLTLVFLVFYSGRIARKSPRSAAYVIILVMFIWILAVLAGGLPTYFPHLFENFTNNICHIGLTTTQSPIPLATIPILLVGILLHLALIVAICTETQSKILIFWTSRKADVRRETYARQRSQSSSTASPEVSMDVPADVYWISGENGSASRNEESNPGCADPMETQGGEKESTEWVRSADSMVDIRNIHVVASVFTILCEIIPQLVFFALDLGIDHMYPYTHHVLISTGLLHGLLLPMCLLRASPRYLATYKTKQRVCCLGNIAESSSSIRPEEELVRQRVRSAVINGPDDRRESSRSFQPPPSPKGPYMAIQDVQDDITVISDDSHKSTVVTLPGMTVSESTDTGQVRSETHVRENGSVNNGYVIETQVIIENTDDVTSKTAGELSTTEDQNLPSEKIATPVIVVTHDQNNGLLGLNSTRGSHLNIARSSSACVDRRSLNAHTPQPAATIRRSPSSVSQMINPPVPDNPDAIHIPETNSDVLGSTVIISGDVNDGEFGSSGAANGVILNGMITGSSGTSSSYCDSDSEQWSHLYDEADDSSQSTRKSAKRTESVPGVEWGEDAAARRGRKHSVTSVTGSLNLPKDQRKKKPHGKKRRASVDNNGHKPERKHKTKGKDVKHGLASCMQMTLTTSLAITRKEQDLQQVTRRDSTKIKPHIETISEHETNGVVRDSVRSSRRSKDDEETEKRSSRGSVVITARQQIPQYDNHPDNRDMVSVKRNHDSIELRTTNPFLIHQRQSELKEVESENVSLSRVSPVRQLSSSNPFLADLPDESPYLQRNLFLDTHSFSVESNPSVDSYFEEEHLSAPAALHSSNPFYEILGLAEKQRLPPRDNENEAVEAAHSTTQNPTRDGLVTTSGRPMDKFLTSRSEDIAEVV